MTIGTVKFFNSSKGFGFISPEGGAKDVFVHATALEVAGMTTLSEGQKLAFDIQPDAKGSKAVNLRNALIVRRDRSRVTYVSAACFLLRCHNGHPMPQDRRATPTIVEELIAVLAPHPGGLRRWSVMRSIRKSREAVAREIPLKLESDVERAFRQFCRNDGMRASGTVLFCRPAEKAGEVWALDTGNADAGENPSKE
jgi:cold shock protein